MGVVVVEPCKHDRPHKICVDIPSYLPMLNSVISHNNYVASCERKLQIPMARGKSNHKKFHLVNWNIVRSSKDWGGLGIKDPLIMNMAMGENILWRLICRKLEWWNKALLKKYIQGNWKRCLQNPLDNKKGSHIWKLIRVVVPLI
jgi:hypothetical protein